MNTDARVLLVDDEPNLLDGIRRQLRGTYHVDTASSPAQALELLGAKNRYAVIVSDMRMPGQNGADLLAQVRKSHPDVIRVMLTGNSDQETAAQAVNRGNVFRFVNKPISLEELNKTLSESLQEHRIQMAERELLQNTLTGAVKVITDVLSIVDSAAFGQAIALRERTKLIVKTMALSNPWELELGAMLMHLGRVVVPGPIAEKLRRGEKLTADESGILQRAPEVGKNLLSHIPRLDVVAKIVLYQNKNFDGSGFPSDSLRGDAIPLGARILRILSDLADLERGGMGLAHALAELNHRTGTFYDPDLFQDITRILLERGAALSTPAVGEKKSAPVLITARELKLGQVLLEHVYTRSGILLLHAGSVVSAPVLERLQNYAKLSGLQEPLKVDRKSPPVMN